MSEFSLENYAVQSYFVYAGILAIKLMLMAPMTSLIRMLHGVFQNPEDAKLFRGEVKFDDSTVERIRRAHLNDLENIPAFWLLGAMYLTIDPSVLLATMLFRIFTVCRIIHTIVYAIFPMPQPTRAIVFIIGLLINFYMGAHVALYYITSI